MIEQYLAIKEKHKDAILFFRLGDFYEMFFEDARLASSELEIVLTARDGGSAERIPMCGIPYHAAGNYIAKLVGAGHKIAICEQVEDPKTARGIVQREVIRIITPGTITDENMLEDDRNNYLAAVVENKQCLGLAYVDVSTGEFQVTEFKGGVAAEQLKAELQRIAPAECLIDNQLELYSQYWTKPGWDFATVAGDLPEAALNPSRARQVLLDHFQTASLEGFGLKGYSCGVQAAAAIILFLKETYKQHLQHVSALKVYHPREYLGMDMVSRKNLEITQSLREGTDHGSLFGILNRCRTNMGKRRLRHWLEQPLRQVKAIDERLDGVEELFSQIELREQLAAVLDPINDMERLCGKLGNDTANARDLLALKTSSRAIIDLKKILHPCQNRLLKDAAEMDSLDDLAVLIETSISPEAPLALKEGGLIKSGFDQEIDELRRLSNEGAAWLVEFENKEKERTGIKHLKVGFNKVFGYYVEISRSNLHLAPLDYVRKQTLVNTERFVCEPLKQYEDKILGAKERLFTLEYDIFIGIRKKLLQHLERIKDSALKVATVDTLLSLADSAFCYDYVRPRVDESGRIEIKGGRHPVVEHFLQDSHFVPNDVQMDLDKHRFMLVTGPNMGGKSTYMRQIALITVMAQAGSFVPACQAHIGVADQIFTRIGASDDLASGHSTFMVEMLEVANILHNASRDSLVILDEIGRGTSTYDGLSIAQAVSEYLVEKVQARTLFATHYHELTSLADHLPNIKNLSVSVKETGDTVVFLKKVLPGKADKSYGIHVARLAGLPGEVIRRSDEILDELEAETNAIKTDQIVEQPALFAVEDPVLTQLRKLDVDNLSPRDALDMLYKWKNEFK